MERVRNETNEIIKSPHDFAAWLQRGKTLFVLSYPELAFGDAFKTRLLIDEASTRETEAGRAAYAAGVAKVFTSKNLATLETATKGPSELDRLVEKVLKTADEDALRLMITGLSSIGAIEDPTKLCEEGKRKYPKNKWFEEKLKKLKERSPLLSITKIAVQCMAEMLTGGYRADGTTNEDMFSQIMNKQVAKQTSRDRSQRDKLSKQTGEVAVRQYPWMDKTMLRRGDDILKALNEDYAKSSKLSPTKSIVFRKSQVQCDSKPATERSKNQQWGVFAAKDLAGDELIVMDWSNVAHINTFNRCEACLGILSKIHANNVYSDGSAYCSLLCLKRASDTYLMCTIGQTFDFKFESTWDMAAWLDVRIFGTLVQENASHPLTGKFMRRYDAAYSYRVLILNLLRFMQDSAQILRKLGIDIFKDHRYDTWVLLTIRFRCHTNMRQYHNVNPNRKEPPFVVITIPQFGYLFNHSCEPNVAEENVKGGSTIAFRARRFIKKGEELFVDYQPQTKKLAKGARQEELNYLLHVDCNCVKCQRETEATVKDWTDMLGECS